MGRRSKYGPQVKSEEDLDIDGREYPLRLDNPRRYDPGAGADSENGPIQNFFGDIQAGDWSWRPNVYRADPGYVFSSADLRLFEGGMYEEDPVRTAKLERQMPTYRVSNA